MASKKKSAPSRRPAIKKMTPAQMKRDLKMDKMKGMS